MQSSLAACAVLVIFCIAVFPTKLTSDLKNDHTRKVHMISNSDRTMHCFSSLARVTLASGGSKHISEVRVGDVILAADSSFVLWLATVIAVPYPPNDIDAIFLELVTATGSDVLRVTPDHLLLAGACDGSPAVLTLASAVSVGDCLLTVSGHELVVSKRTVHGAGLYSVVTDKEFIVVNGIIASPFAVNHAAAHAFYSAHRLLFRIMPSLLKSGLIADAQNLFQDLISCIV